MTVTVEAMPAPVATGPRPINQDEFLAARGWADKWRGQCIGLFAQMEAALGFLLVRSRHVPCYSDMRPAWPHLVGQRIDRARKLLAMDGPLKRHAEKMAPVLDAWAAEYEFRNFLCHGALEVAITSDHKVIFLFQMTEMRGSNPVERALPISQSAAGQRLKRLEIIAKTTIAELERVTGPLPKAPPKAAVAEVTET